MKAIVTGILTSVFEEYINPIQNCQLDVAIWQGNAQLQNVTIKSTALSSHDFPFTVKEGIIKSISLHFPWNAINSMPCIIEIDGVNLVANFSKEIEMNTDIKVKESYLKDLENACQGNEESQNGILSGIFTTLIDNIIFKIKNVHIRVELESKSKESQKTFAAGLILEDFECFTINDKGEQAFVNSSNIRLRKQIYIKGFSLYIDSGNSPLNQIKPINSNQSDAQEQNQTQNNMENEGNNESNNDLNSENEDNHEYILKDFSFSSIFTRTKDKSENNTDSSKATPNHTQTEILNQIPDFSFKFDKNQLLVLKEFIYQQNMFNMRQKYFICGHPPSLPKSQRSSGKWWRYIHRCTIEKRFPNRIKVNDVIQMLKTRQIYHQLWETRQTLTLENFKKSHHYNILKNIESSLNLNTILFLRSYSEYKIKQNLNKDNFNEIVFDPDELNTLLIKNSTFSSFLMSIVINKFNIDIFDFQNNLNTLVVEPVVSLSVLNMNGMFTKTIEKDTSFSFTCKNFNIFTPNEEIFGQTTSSEIEKPMFSLTYKNYPAKLEREIDVIANSPSLNIDLDLIYSVTNLFSSQTTVSYSVSPKEEPSVSIQKRCEEYPFIKLNVDFFSPKVKLANTQLTLGLDNINIKSFPIHDRTIQNQETLYSDFELHLQNLFINYDKDLILYPFSTYVKYSTLISPVESIDQYKVFIDMSTISLELSKTSCKGLFHSLNYLMKPRSFQIESINKNNNGVQTNQKNIELTKTFASSVKFKIQKVMLNLITIGEFNIIDVSSTIVIHKDSSNIALKAYEIECLNTENKYIEFVKDTNIKNFKNAISGIIDLSPNNRIFCIDINNPVIVIDFEWIGKCINFFKKAKKTNNTNESPRTSKLNQDTSQNVQSAQHLKAGNKTVNTYEIVINTPKCILNLPTVDENENIKVVFDLEKVGVLNHLLSFSNTNILINERVIAEKVDFKYSELSVLCDFIELNLEENDYPLLLELSDYITNKYDKYFSSDKNSIQMNSQVEQINKKSNDFYINIGLVNINLKEKLGIKFESFSLKVSEKIEISLNEIEILEMFTYNVMTNFTSLSIIKDGNSTLINISPSSCINLDILPTHFLYYYFVDKDNPHRIKVDEKVDVLHQRERKIQIITQDLCLELTDLGTAVINSVALIFEMGPKGFLMKINGNSLSIMRKNNKVNSYENDYFLMTNSDFALTFTKQLIKMRLDNTVCKYDLDEILKYANFSSGILHGIVKETEDKPVSVPLFKYDIQISELNANLENSSVFLKFHNFVLKNTVQDLTKLYIGSDSLSFSSKQANFINIDSPKICVSMTVRESYPNVTLNSNNSAASSSFSFSDNSIDFDFSDKSSINSSSSNLLDLIISENKNNFLHKISIYLLFDFVSFDHKNEFVDDLCQAIIYMFSKKNNEEKTEESKKYHWDLKISVIINSLYLTFNALNKILLNDFKYKMYHGQQYVNVHSLKLQDFPDLLYNDSLNHSKDVFTMKMEDSLMECLLTNFTIKLNFNSEIIINFLSELLDSPFLSMNFGNKEYNDKQTNKKRLFMNIHFSNFKLILINSLFSLNLDLSGHSILSDNLLQLVFDSLSCFYSENDIVFEPIIQNLNVHLEKAKDNLFIILRNCNFNISPSDIIDFQALSEDIMRFLQQQANKLLNRNLKNKNFEETQENNQRYPINELKIVFDPIIFNFCEDNRKTRIPFPFIRVSIPPVDLTLKPCSPVIVIDVNNILTEMFNKKTQKWDLLHESISLSVKIENKKMIKVSVVSGMNLVLSSQILNQIRKFSFTRSKYEIKPEYIIENHSNDVCNFLFNGKNEVKVMPDKIFEFYDTKKFLFDNRTIVDPNHFVSPLYIGSKYSLSVFIKNGFRFLSINSFILFKNNTDISLVFQGITQNNHENIVALYPHSFSSISLNCKSFILYGETHSLRYDPQKNPSKRISLLALKEKREASIPVFVGNIKFIMKISLKFSQKRGVLVLRIRPKFTVINYLPFPVEFVIPQTKTIVSIPSKSHQFLNHYGFADNFLFHLKIGQKVTRDYQLFLNNDIVTIPVYFNDVNAISVSHQRNVISIKPPVFLKNQTNFQISLFDKNNRKICKILERQTGVIGPIEYFNEIQSQKKIMIYLSIDGYSKSHLVEIGDDVQPVLMPSLKFSGMFLPLFLSGSYDSHGTINLQINYMIEVKNLTKKYICLQSVNLQNCIIGIPLIVKSKETMAITCASKMFIFNLSIEGINEYTTICLQQKDKTKSIHSTLLLNDKEMVEVEFQESINSTIYVILRECTFPQPLMITNLLEDSIIHLQESRLKVLPMSTKIVATKSLPNSISANTTSLTHHHSVNSNRNVNTIKSANLLSFVVMDENINVNLEILDFPIKHEIRMNDNSILLFVEIQSLSNGSHLIIVSRRIERCKSFYDIGLSIDIPRFSISLVDDKTIELSLFTLTNTSFNFNRSRNIDSFSVFIDTIQIDDMYPDVPIPVVAYNRISPFMSMVLSKATNSNTSFKQAYLKLNDMILYIDSNFISELIYFFKGIVQSDGINQYKPKNINTKKTKSSKNRENLVKNTFSFEMIRIEPINFNVSVRFKSGRVLQHNYESDILQKFIPPISHVGLTLDFFEKKNISGTSNQISRILVDNYKHKIKAHIISLILSAPEGIVRSASDILHQIHEDSHSSPVTLNNTPSRSISSGFESFTKGLAKAVTGIVTEPMNGLQTNGASGLIGGLVRGTLGVVLQPTAGLLDATTGIIDGVKNAFQDQRKVVRDPRTFSNGQIIPYDNVSSWCQLSFQRLIENYNETFSYFIKGKTGFVGITQNYLVIFGDYQDNLKVKYLNKLTEIKKVYNEGRLLKVDFLNGKQLIVDCESQDIAKNSVETIFSLCCFSIIINV
ncbi:hypothetical protein TRFO_12839 [Tritrichomonas foetus]|uniref:Chorein N-terminal domain-containing protein n=1 Tax=Tritrichomonas foetus TaxID=1144522 RepID=A0A1J4L4P2_9EUKA|nr:hypothetical protein TRFO_12839 [Tritrichomonas foetus]|eukprot:OHT16948.1 hypothetical protein TRFO_12839 [Tritrichomonas foetus]